MDITELKSGLWGYKKNYVCEYIAGMNEQFSQRLMEMVKNYDRQIEELHAKITSLEEENVALQNDCNRVTQILADAKSFSDELRAKTEAENKEVRSRNQNYNNEQMERIREFSEGIDRIRDSIRALMTSIDHDLELQQMELSMLSNGSGDSGESQEGTSDHEA